MRYQLLKPQSGSTRPPGVITVPAVPDAVARIGRIYTVTASTDPRYRVDDRVTISSTRERVRRKRPRTEETVITIRGVGATEYDGRADRCEIAADENENLGWQLYDLNTSSDPHFPVWDVRRCWSRRMRDKSKVKGTWYTTQAEAQHAAAMANAQITTEYLAGAAAS
jgi:hypothetical protein